MSRIMRVSVNHQAHEAAEDEDEDEYDFPDEDDPQSPDYPPGPLGFYDYDPGYDYQSRQWDPNRKRAVALGGSLVLLVAIFSVIVFLLSVRNSAQANGGAGSNGVSANTSGLDTAPRTGALAPDFSLVDVHTNQTVQLSSLRGKPVFVNFWGTWCPPCRAEMPEMQRLYDKYPGQLEILGISMGPRDYPDQVKNFVDQYKYPWTFIHDPNYSVATAYQVTAIPSSYFIDKAGVIRAVQVGAMNLETMDHNFQLIR